MDYGQFAIFCKDCGRMFYASSSDPIVVADDAKTIQGYRNEGHLIRPTTIEEVKSSFGAGGCPTCTR